MDQKGAGHRPSSRVGVVGALALVTVLLVRFGSPVVGQVLLAPGEEASTERTEREVLAASREWFTALMGADREVLIRLQTDDFLMVERTATGVAVVARETQLASLAKAPADRPRFERELLNVKVRRYGTVAVLTALARFRGRVDDKPVASQSVLTEVWVNGPGGWRLANIQATDVPVAPPSAR